MSSLSIPRRPLAALVVALGLALPGPVLANAQAARAYEDALVRFERQDYGGAIVQLKNALAQDRRMLQAQLLLGRALLADGQAAAAEVALDEALRLGVNAVEVVLPLADALTAQGRQDAVLGDRRLADAQLPAAVRGPLLMRKAGAASDLGRHQDALSLLTESRTLGQDGAESWASEVPIRLRARQLPEARAAADRAVAANPRSAAALYQRATVTHIGGDLNTALQHYALVLEVDPDHLDTLVARAGVHLDLALVVQARGDIERARRVDPQDPRAAYLAALLAGREGRRDEERAALLQVTNLIDPVPMAVLRFRPQVLMLGGMSHFALGQLEKAKPYLEMVVRNDSTSPVAKLLGQIYLREDRNADAIQVLEAYRRSFPGDPQGALLLSTALRQQGFAQRAINLLESMLRERDDPALRASLGLSLLAASRVPEAVQALEAAWAKDPAQVQAGTTLVSLYISAQQGAKAVQVAKALSQRMPQNAALATLLGEALRAQGDLPAARAAYERALSLDANLAEPALNLARLDLAGRQLDAAQRRLTAILARDDKQVDALMEMARVSNARNRPDEALRWLQRANDHAGGRLQPGLLLVDFHLAAGRPDLAKEAVAALRSRAPEAMLVLLTAARVHLAAGEPNDARSVLNRASVVAGFDAAALAEVAELQLAAGHVPGAAHALDKALEARPQHLRARTLRATVHLAQGEPDRAETLARGLVASEPRSGVGHALLGDVARARGQAPAAVLHYRRAHDLDKSSASLLRLFAAQEGTQRAAAFTLAEQWLRTQPGDLAVRRALGDAQARAGDMAAARRSYEALLEAAPDDADTLNNLAVVRLALKDVPGALRAADRALALRPQVPHIVGTAGWAAFHAGQTDRALQLLRDARLRDPNNPGTRYFLGAVLAQQGRRGEAREELQAALSAGPGFAYAAEARALLQGLRP